ncbi:hypothetical protein F4804DRAFT_37292 [Jackrogersella minutella]|nr:hypothetical protein F4804DRAFT_37292 [Jackrogersella minutella]
MQSHMLSGASALSPALIREIANAGALDEISNHPGAVRNYIFNHSMRDKKSGKTQRPLLFAIYQTGRHGPQNGYRLCLVHRGFPIASATKKDGDSEDDIDRIEKALAGEGHEEVVILGHQDVTSDS